MSVRRTIEITATIEETRLSVDDLCRLGQVTPEWVAAHIDSGLLPAPAPDPSQWQFGTQAVQRVRRMAWLERDFDAVPELAALVADLQDEIDRLRAALRRTAR